MAKKSPAEPERKRPGRPATGRKRPCQLLIHLSAEERAEIDAAAKRAGLRPTVWGLEAMLAAARLDSD